MKKSVYSLEINDKFQVNMSFPSPPRNSAKKALDKSTETHR